MVNLITQKELASLVGVDAGYISRLVKQGIFDGCFEGKKLKKECALEKYYAFKQGRRTKRGTKEVKSAKKAIESGNFSLEELLGMVSSPIDKVSIYKDYWAAKVNELKFEKERGKYYLKDEIDKKAEKILTAFRNKTLALPTKVAPALVGLEDLAEIKQILENAVYELLDELSRLEELV